MSLFSVAGTGANGIPLGSHFLAHEKIETERSFYGGLTEDEFKGWVFEQFRKAYHAKKPETERLKTMELYYSGFHYLDPQMNRENTVTNLCFSTVETVHPVMVEQKPRPEIVARRQYKVAEGEQDPIAAVQEYATWVMDTTEFDLAYAMNTREKLKYGWCVTLLVSDPRTGICYPKVYSVFDFYKDPYCRHEDEMEFFFLAGPCPTAWLQEQFPDKAADIFADNIASPAYDVCERPYFDAYDAGGAYNTLEAAVGGAFNLEGEAAKSGSQPLVTPGDGHMTDTGTTFLLRMFVRDRRKVPVQYRGDIASPEGEAFVHTPSAKNFSRNEPVSPSGWVCVPITASGVILNPHAVDECFLGAPVEIGRDYAQAGRFYCPGELDHAIPLNRAINFRKNALNKSLGYETVPVLVADSDTGIDIDQRSVEPGDVLKKLRGSTIQWLDFRGAASQQFEMLALDKGDLQQVTGVQDVSQGRRPEGIEAAAAIRNLQDAAQTRIRGKEGPSNIEWARILKKMLVATGKKCKERIYFRGRNGDTTSVDPAWLCYEYDLRFARGTGSVLGRAAKEEKTMALVGAGLIDQETALEDLDVPNIPVVLQRLQAQNAIAAQAAAAAKPAPPAA